MKALIQRVLNAAVTHNLRSDYSGNPQIAELVTDRGAGGNPRTLNINETH